MSRPIRRATHPLAASNRIARKNIGADADTFSSIAFIHKSSFKENYPRDLSTLAENRICNNRRLRSASTETQRSRTESVAEEHAPRNDHNLCLRTDTGSLDSKGCQQVDETICPYHNLSPSSPDFCYSMRQYLMEQDEVLLFESNESITTEMEARRKSPIDGVHSQSKRHALPSERDLRDRNGKSGKDQLPLSTKAWKMAVSAIEDFNHEIVFEEP